MSSFNKESVLTIADNIIDVIDFCLANKSLLKNDKAEFLKRLEGHNYYFYNKYNRICRDVVEMDNIEPLISMLKTFYKVQNNEMDYEKANKFVGDAINGTYVEPILNSETLKKEREKAIAKER